MTGYQKLKKENEILWEEIEKLLGNSYQDHTEENIDDIVEREIAWIKWKIKNETK